MNSHRHSTTVTPTTSETSKRAAALFGRPTLDRVVKEVADFLFEHVADGQRQLDAAGAANARNTTFEIEAKFGTIIDRATGKRLRLPVKSSECILVENLDGIRFESAMSAAMHAFLNKYLNERVSASKAAGDSSIGYKHMKQIDEFIVGEAKSGAGRLRRTRDAASGDVVAVMEKRRLGDLHLHLPFAYLDCRISVNTEHSLPGSSFAEYEKSPVQSSRHKDRFAYSVEGVAEVDLTQVRSDDAGTTFELELEMLDTERLCDERDKCSRGEHNVYIEKVQMFVDCVRSIVNRVPIV